MDDFYIVWKFVKKGQRFFSETSQNVGRRLLRHRIFSRLHGFFSAWIKSVWTCFDVNTTIVLVKILVKILEQRYLGYRNFVPKFSVQENFFFWFSYKFFSKCSFSKFWPKLLDQQNFCTENFVLKVSILQIFFDLASPKWFLFRLKIFAKKVFHMGRRKIRQNCFSSFKFSRFLYLI